MWATEGGYALLGRLQPQDQTIPVVSLQAEMAIRMRVVFEVPPFGPFMFTGRARRARPGRLWREVVNRHPGCVDCLKGCAGRDGYE